MNGAKVSDWQLIDWKAVGADVTNIRQRIFVASRENDLKKVVNLQKLMLRSRANWLQSIRKVTQINKGRRTPGVDRQVITTPEERVDLFYWLESISLNEWNPPPTRRVEIPKGADKTRPLSIPTVKDRIIQAIVKNALEPYWEAKFEATSHGFRPGRSTHDAIEDVWVTLNGGKRQWVLDADIKGASDNINQEKLMDLIGLFPARFLIRKWLKAGVMIDLELTPTDSGTPQGGIVSPLLANIALHGMEEALGIIRTRASIRKGVPTIKYRGPIKVVKYADDLVVMTETKAQAEEAKTQLTQWLGRRGLTLSEEKTTIVHATAGFDFLGFTVIRRKNAQSKRGYALHIIPSKKSLQKVKEKIREIVRENRANTPDQLLWRLNPLIRGWSMYYRPGVSSKTFQKLDRFVWKQLWKWALRRHPNKGKRWVYDKYYDQEGHRRWILKSEKGTLRLFSDTKIKRHLKVIDRHSPDDPELILYWITRRRKQNPELGARAALFDRQKGVCPHCADWLDRGEDVHLHHKDNNRANNKISNL